MSEKERREKERREKRERLETESRQRVEDLQSRFDELGSECSRLEQEISIMSQTKVQMQSQVRLPRLRETLSHDIRHAGGGRRQPLQPVGG